MFATWAVGFGVEEDRQLAVAAVALDVGMICVLAEVGVVLEVQFSANNCYETILKKLDHFIITIILWNTINLLPKRNKNKKKMKIPWMSSDWQLLYSSCQYKLRLLWLLSLLLQEEADKKNIVSNACYCLCCPLIENQWFKIRCQSYLIKNL